MGFFAAPRCVTVVHSSFFLLFLPSIQLPTNPICWPLISFAPLAAAFSRHLSLVRCHSTGTLSSPRLQSCQREFFFCRVWVVASFCCCSVFAGLNLSSLFCSAQLMQVRCVNQWLRNASLPTFSSFFPPLRMFFLSLFCLFCCCLLFGLLFELGVGVPPPPTSAPPLLANLPPGMSDFSGCCPFLEKTMKWPEFEGRGSSWHSEGGSDHVVFFIAQTKK
eukprot:RCo048557